MIDLLASYFGNLPARKLFRYAGCYFSNKNHPNRLFTWVATSQLYPSTLVAIQCLSYYLHPHLHLRRNKLRSHSILG